MTNIFAYRATNPKDMMSEEDPVGKENDDWILASSIGAGLVVCVWGNYGQYLSRSAAVLKMLSKPYCLHVNRSGEPAHPLYLRNDLRPRPFIINTNLHVSQL